MLHLFRDRVSALIVTLEVLSVFAFRYDSGKKCFDGTCLPKTEEVLSGKISTGISGLSLSIVNKYVKSFMLLWMEQLAVSSSFVFWSYSGLGHMS